MILLTIMLCIIGAVIGWYTPQMIDRVIEAKKAKAIAPAKPKLSPVSQQLVKEYNEIPEDSRPFPDITQMLVDLDERYSLDAAQRDAHFNAYDYNYTARFSWSGDRYGSCRYGKHGRHGCKFYDYYRLHETFEEVKKSVAKKERAMLESRTAHTADQIAELERSLRQEIRLNNEFAAQMRALD